MHEPGPRRERRAAARLEPHHGLLILSVVAALLLVSTSALSHRDARDAARLVNHGQAETLRHALRGVLDRGDPSRLSEADLAEAIATYADDGLRYVALYGQGGELLVAAGTSSKPAWVMEPDPSPLRVEELGDRVRCTVNPPRRRPPRRGPPPSSDTVDTVRPGPHVFEFEPVAANQLRTGALRGAGASLAGVLLLALATGLLWHQSRAREAAERAAARDRHLAALGQMTATMSHELRTPLTSLKGHAQLLAAQLPEGSRERTKAADLVQDVERLQALSEGLLRLARSGRAEPAWSDPLAPLLGALADEGIEAAPRLVGEVRSWHLDADRVRQALGNLLRNATQSEGRSADIEVVVETRPRALVYRILDRGQGLPDGDAEALFEPFVTGRAQGTGLGLALARQIAAAHGGELIGHNRAGGGAEFVLTLPAAPDPERPRRRNE